MNISADALRRAAERGGDPAEERPDYVDDALQMDRQVGFRDGKPLVPDGQVDLKLGDTLDGEYSHYPDDPFLPSAGSFIGDLFAAEEVGSIADAAEELKVDRRDLEQAADLHGVDPPEEVPDTDTDDNSVILPSGERIPLDLLNEPVYEDKLLLAVLLSSGMGIGEIARYVGREVGEKVSESDVRAAARESGLLPTEGDSRQRTSTDPTQATTSDGEYVSDPW